MTDTTNTCTRCGGPGANAYNSLAGASGEWTHYFMGDCIDHLRARVDAGNTRIAELEAALDDAQLDADESREERDAAEARTAKLEEVQGWFSELSDPAPEGQMHYVRVVAWKRQDGWYTVTGHPLTPTDWRPLTPPPTAAEYVR